MKIPKLDFRAKTPRWARIVRNLSASVAAASVSLLNLPFELSPRVTLLAEVLAVLGIVLGIFAQGFKEGGNDE